MFDINEETLKAILQEQIEKAIAEKVEDLTSEIEGLVNRIVGGIVEKRLDEEFWGKGHRLEEVFSNHLTEEFKGWISANWGVTMEEILQEAMIRKMQSLNFSELLEVAELLKKKGE